MRITKQEARSRQANQWSACILSFAHLLFILFEVRKVRKVRNKVRTGAVEVLFCCYDCTSTNITLIDGYTLFCILDGHTYLVR